MKNPLSLLFLSVLSLSFCHAQKMAKTKGNKIVKLINTEVTPFHTINLDEDFEIDLIFNKTPSVEVEADENLHEYIKFEVVDSILTFNKTRRITSKKKLYIKVNHNNILQHIQTSQNSRITSLVPVELAGNGTLKTSGSSKAELTLKTNIFEFTGQEKSRVKLNLVSDSCTVDLSGNSKIEALINTEKFKGYLLQRSNALIEGNCDSQHLELDNNTQFIGKNFTSKSCNVSCDISSDAHIEVLNEITINATGNSSIYLYQDPKITIENFTDTAKLQKKVKK